MRETDRYIGKQRALLTGNCQKDQRGDENILFRCQVVVIWNNLHERMLEADSERPFKRELTTYLLRRNLQSYEEKTAFDSLSQIVRLSFGRLTVLFSSCYIIRFLALCCTSYSGTHRKIKVFLIASISAKKLFNHLALTSKIGLLTR